MDQTLLLFDIDGTLVDSQGAGATAMRIVCAGLFGDKFSFDKVHFPGKLDHAIFAEAAKTSGFNKEQAPEDKFRAAYAKELEKQMSAMPKEQAAIRGVTELLAQLRKMIVASKDSNNNSVQDVNNNRLNGNAPVLGLLTGNYSNTGPIKLKAAGIDDSWFTITAFGDEASTRPQLTELAMKKYFNKTGKRISPKKVVVIGDTPLDVHCAKEHECIAFGVATGAYTPSQLKEAGADIAVEDLCDASPLLELL